MKPELPKARDSVENAYLRIRKGILAVTYTSGEHLTGETLAAAIGVSRTPVREALRRLDAEGLVRVVPNQGAYVIGFTVADLAQIFALRAVLESYACELATPLLTDAEIERIAELAQITLALALDRPEPNAAGLAKANSEIHLTIVRATGNTRLGAMISGVTELPLVMRTLSTYSPDDLLRSARHHIELVAAFRARDPAWASAVMRSHLLAARRAILGEAQ